MAHLTKIILAFVFANMLLIACAPMPVKIIADKSYDLKSIKSYDILPNEQDDLANLELDKTVIHKIITNTIEEQLSTKNFQKTNVNPDVLISYYIVGNIKTDVFYVNQYYGNLGYRFTPARTSTRDSLNLQESTYEEGILIIDIIEANSNRRVWQGYLTSRTGLYREDEKKEQRLRKSVVKILSNLP